MVAPAAYAGMLCFTTVGSHFKAPGERNYWAVTFPQYLGSPIRDSVRCNPGAPHAAFSALQWLTWLAIRGGRQEVGPTLRSSAPAGWWGKEEELVLVSFHI